MPVLPVHVLQVLEVILLPVHVLPGYLRSKYPGTGSNEIVLNLRTREFFSGRSSAIFDFWFSILNLVRVRPRPAVSRPYLGTKYLATSRYFPLSNEAIFLKKPGVYLDCTL